MFTKVYAAGWDKVGEAKEKGFFDFDFITWMAWTWQTAAFFLFILVCFDLYGYLGNKSPRRIAKERYIDFRYN